MTSPNRTTTDDREEMAADGRQAVLLGVFCLTILLIMLPTLADDAVRQNVLLHAELVGITTISAVCGLLTLLRGWFLVSCARDDELGHRPWWSLLKLVDDSLARLRQRTKE